MNKLLFGSIVDCKKFDMKAMFNSTNFRSYLGFFSRLYYSLWYWSKIMVLVQDCYLPYLSVSLVLAFYGKLETKVYKKTLNQARKYVLSQSSIF